MSPCVWFVGLEPFAPIYTEQVYKHGRFFMYRMGYHIFCQVRCQILPEFLPFIRGKYLRSEVDGTNVPPAYRHFIQIWKRLDFGNAVNNHDLTADGVFTCHIEKKPYNHRGDLWRDYEEFLKHIIVPISSEILFCKISEDDMTMREEIYTDNQLRNIQFRLQDLVEEVEHIYEDDMIVGTRVMYKRAFKRSKALDLTRMYERS